MLFTKKFFWIFLFHIFYFISALDESSFLLIPFKGKSLLNDDKDDEDFEPMWESDYPYVPKEEVYNSSRFINEWFYNGMYTYHTIGSKQIESYINIENSKLSIDKITLIGFIQRQF